MFVAVCREKTSTALFFKYNSQLGPPYQVLVDTNFINFSIKNKVSCIAIDLSCVFACLSPAHRHLHACLQQLQHTLLTGSCAAQIDLVQGMMDCLYAECTPCITDCVLAELEKLGQKYRVALKVAKVCSGRTQCSIQSPHFAVLVVMVYGMHHHC